MEDAAADGNGGAKLYLRKRADAAPSTPLSQGSSRLLMTRMPMRIYCDFVAKTKAGDEFSTVLVSDSSTATSVLFSALEKFNLPRNEAYALYMYTEEQRKPDEEEWEEGNEGEEGEEGKEAMRGKGWGKG